MSELESVHEEVEDEEVHFRADEPRVGSPTPPIPVTTIDMDVIIRGWEEKFEHLSRCLREVQLASEKANSDMCDINKEGRARGNEQERCLQAMHVGLTDFLHAPLSYTPGQRSHGEHAVCTVDAHRNTSQTAPGI